MTTAVWPAKVCGQRREAVHELPRKTGIAMTVCTINSTAMDPRGPAPGAAERKDCEDGTSEIWNMFIPEVNPPAIRENRGWEFEIPGYPYTPVSEGRILSYGDYDLETVGLKGTYLRADGTLTGTIRYSFARTRSLRCIAHCGHHLSDEHLLLRGYFDSLEG